MTDVTVAATRYTVSAVPEDNINRHLFEIVVKYQGNGFWYADHCGYALGADGTWDPAAGTSGRFDLDTALRLAREAAPHLTVNRYTVERVLAQAAERIRHDND